MLDTHGDVRKLQRLKRRDIAELLVEQKEREDLRVRPRRRRLNGDFWGLERASQTNFRNDGRQDDVGGDVKAGVMKEVPGNGGRAFADRKSFVRQIKSAFKTAKAAVED